jgi:hypothetical protein
MKLEVFVVGFIFVLSLAAAVWSVIGYWLFGQSAEHAPGFAAIAVFLGIFFCALKHAPQRRA